MSVYWELYSGGHHGVGTRSPEAFNFAAARGKGSELRRALVVAEGARTREELGGQGQKRKVRGSRGLGAFADQNVFRRTTQPMAEWTAQNRRDRRPKVGPREEIIQPLT